MSEEKHGSVKSEISPDGGLKLTIKREKPAASDARQPEWVTEARGDGLGKLVIKRKSNGHGHLSRSPKRAVMHADAPTEQRHVLRLSLTASASADGNRLTQVKTWSLCELPSAVEDVASASEMSPACQLQPSPKDSGVDMSSPPRDDGTVGVEPNASGGVWSDPHAGFGSTAETDKPTPCSLEKLETSVSDYSPVASSAVYSGSGELWNDTAAPCSRERNRPIIQSTLRSRRERSALKSFTVSSQKLVNPLAKKHRVGRYQHMLPVSRIRSEANAARRKSLEESPTYNMVASRAGKCPQLPRVKTKLKLLSDNTYAPVIDPDAGEEQQKSAEQKSKQFCDEKPLHEVTECIRSCVSTESSPVKKSRLKFCIQKDKGQLSTQKISLGGDVEHKIPKLKLVVKSESSVSVSRTCEQSKDSSASAAVKPAEENSNSPEHLKLTRRQREVAKTDSGDYTERGSLRRRLRSGLTAEHALSSDAADDGSRQKKRKGSKVKPVSDKPRREDASEVSESAKQVTSPVRESSDLQPFPDSQLCDPGTCTAQLLSSRPSSGESVPDVPSGSSCSRPSFDESVSDMRTGSSSVHTDGLNTCHGDVLEEGSKSSAADPCGAEVASIDRADSVTPADIGSDDTSAGHQSHNIDLQEHRHSNAEAPTESNSMSVDTDSDEKETSGLRKEVSLDVCAATDVVGGTMEDESAAVQTSSMDTSVPCAEEAASDTGKPHVDETTRAVSVDWNPPEEMSTAEPEKSHHTCIAVDSENKSTADEPSLDLCTGTVIPPLSASHLSTDDPLISRSLSNTTVSTEVSDQTHADEATDEKLSAASEPPAGACEGVKNSSAPSHGDRGSKISQLDCKGIVVEPLIVPELQNAENDPDTSSDLHSLSDEYQSVDEDSEEMYSDPAVPPHSLSTQVSSEEHKDTCTGNTASSSGFLAAFAQFVQKSCVKKKSKPADCHVTKTDDALKSADSDAEQLKSAIHAKPPPSRSCAAERRRRTCSEKVTFIEDQSPCHVTRRQSTSMAESASTKEMSVCSDSVDSSNQSSHHVTRHESTGLVESASSKEAPPVCSDSIDSSNRLASSVAEDSIDNASKPADDNSIQLKPVRRRKRFRGVAPSRLDTIRLDDADTSEHLVSSAAEDIYPAVSREDMQTAVDCHHQLVNLRHRVCDLLETILPELELASSSDFCRDSACVERLVSRLVDACSSGTARIPATRRCSDPAVLLHRRPKECLRSFQRLVIKLLTLLLPDTDLSSVDADSLDVFLELMTSVNRPLPVPGVFCLPRTNLHACPESSLSPLNKLPLESHHTSAGHAVADVMLEQTEVSLPGTEKPTTPTADKLFSMQGLLPLNTASPVGEKRSIRRQVKDCLMFLDRDLT